MSPAENLAAALAFRKEGKPDAAVAAALKALAEDPSLAEAWECAAFIYMQQSRWKLALGVLKSATTSVPGNATLEIYHALALAETGSLPEAQARIDDVLHREPKNAQALFVRAEILASAGHYGLAQDAYAAASKHDVVRKSAAFALSGARFMAGDFAAAMPGLSALEDEAPDAPPLPLWDGKSPQHVVLYGSQGFGDVLMFLRYVKAAQAALKVTLRVPYQLAQLVRDSFPDLSLIVSKDASDANAPQLPPGVGFDLPKDAQARCPLIRLSWMLAGGFDVRAGDIPYLRADAAKIAGWDERLAALPLPRIGLVWSGSPRNAVDHRRSVPFQMLQPLIAQVRPHLVSLQMGPESVCAGEAGIFDASPLIRDFSDSAALLSTLDLLITVDTAAAHLAGALGRPVWNLMPFRPTDWRWLLGREDTIWYPSMRLFRQKTPGDWARVVDEVTADLKNLWMEMRARYAPRGEAVRCENGKLT